MREVSKGEYKRGIIGRMLELVFQEGYHKLILGRISKRYFRKDIRAGILRKISELVSQEGYQRGILGRISERYLREDIREVSQGGYQRGILGRISERYLRKDIREVSQEGINELSQEGYQRKDIIDRVAKMYGLYGLIFF